MNWHNRGVHAELLKRAKEAALKTYSPYSRFPVGAAGLFLNDRGHHTYTSGTNIENASFGLTICAERTAIFKAVSEGYTSLVALAVTCPALDEDDPDQAKTPCGACRQVMAEFASETTVIIVDQVGNFRLEELLPRAFLLRRT